MSTADLQSLTSKVEELFKKSIRQEVKANVGQIFAYNRKRTLKLLEFAFVHAEVPKAEQWAKKFNEKIERELKVEEAKAIKLVSTGGTNLKKAEMERYKAGVRGGRVSNLKKSMYKLYLVRNYNVINTLKRDLGKSVEVLTKARGKKTVDSTSVTGAATGSGKKGRTGDNLGHGEFGAPVSLLKIIKIEQALAKFGAPGSTMNAITVIKDTYGITTKLKHSLILTNKGKFRKDFSIIISNQSARVNALDSKKEQNFRNAVKRLIKKDLVTFTGSPSIKQGVAKTVLSSLTSGKKNLKASGPNRPSRKVVSSGWVTNKGKITEEKRFRVSQLDLIDRPGDEREFSPQSDISQLAAIINAKLPQQVAANMGSPRLNYRTGRFADSTRVVGITPTPQGFPSIAYTYMLYPYQTFEPGFAQGSVNRDPRKLINLSIRQLAVQHMQGRFYTRRV